MQFQNSKNNLKDQEHFKTTIMKKFETRDEAFASQNYDPNAVVITGVPEHHVEALKAVANLFVGYDAAQPDFDPDHTNYDQRKYEAIFDFDASPGGRFAVVDDDYWRTSSSVGARLVAESSQTCRSLAELFGEDWQKFMTYRRKQE